MIKYNILSRFTGSVLFTAEIDCLDSELESVKLGLSVKWGLENKKNLSGANLSGANLSGANLSGANLSGANLSSANLRGADLPGANLSSADLPGANLSGANLSSANLRSADLPGANLSSANFYSADLRGANLSGANLRGADLPGANLSSANLSSANFYSADLRGADLSGADLRGADLPGANLSGANLSSANLRSADLRGTKGSELVIAQTRILPEGEIIGWKKCRDQKIVKLLIPREAKRSHAFGRKCRAEYVKCLEIFGSDGSVQTEAISLHDRKTKYTPGEFVYPDKFSDNWQDECAPGIHFYITRIEAENHL